MIAPFAAALQALLHPGTAFQAEPPPLGRAVRNMALVWVPLALVNAALTVSHALQAYGVLRQGAVPAGVLGWLGADPEHLQAFLGTLPPPPTFGQVWPWLLLAVPLGVLGTWLHHAVWDHTGLWLLGGLKQKRGFRTSLLAEAEALPIAALGILPGLAGFLPVLGPLLALPLLLLDGYLWLFRGFALAARHGCEPWRGVAATVVHAALLGCFGLGIFTLMLLLLRMGA
ncbi:MAG: hypothetical protein U0P46_10085 [Holophagaceae bacterium]